MDYRELENRMERNRALIKERAYDRLAKEAIQANKAQRLSWFTWVRNMLTLLKRPKTEPQLHVVIKPRPQFKQQH